MKYRLQACVALIGFIVAGSALAERDRLRSEALNEAMARVRVVSESRRVAYGSAVAVRADRVITSCHGTRRARWIDVFAGGRALKVNKVVSDFEHDLCLLEVEQNAFVPFPMSEGSADLQLGDAVTAIGFTGSYTEVVDGTVRALHPLDGATVIQTDAAFRGGESGGALLNRDEKLVGILTFLANGRGGGFFAVPVKWVAKLMQRADADQGPQPQSDIAFWERPDAQRPVFLRALAREYAEDWEEMKRIAAQWVEQEPQNPEAWIALGKARYFSREESAAVQALHEAVALAPRHTEGWSYLARAQGVLNEQEGLQESLKRLEELSPAAARALREEQR